MSSQAADLARRLDGGARLVSVLGLGGTGKTGRRVVERLTALMTVVEGHAEFVMDGVGPGVVPTVETIRSKFNARRVARNPVEKVLRRLLGVEVKMRQYAEGRKFVAAVVEQVGMAGFNRIWESPANLPLTDELTDPSAWVTRVHGHPAPTTGA